MTKKDKIIEIMTYLIVPTIFLVISPLIAKLLDRYLLNETYILTSNVYFLITSILIVLGGLLLIFNTSSFQVN